jgi:hypothetical protein
MDASNAAPLPAPSAAWSHLAVMQTLDELDNGGVVAPLVGGAHRRTDDAAGLRARLLDMIVTSERTRKAAAAESKRPR